MARTVAVKKPKLAKAFTLRPAALTAKERVVTDARALTTMLTDHATALLADGQLEHAQKRATRAHGMAEELGDPALLRTTLRARIETLRGVASRATLSDALTRALLKVLEAQPEDTRRERAALWESLGGEPWWIERGPSLESAAFEANVQRALGLYRAAYGDGLGTEDDIARTLTLLRKSLEERRDIEARGRLFTEVAKWPPELRARLKAAGLDFPG